MVASKPELRAAIVQRFQEGQTRPQIAEALGITRGAVASHLARWSLSRDDDPARVLAPSNDDGAAQARQRQADRSFVRKLALAIRAGEHLPRGGAAPLKGRAG